MVLLFLTFFDGSSLIYPFALKRRKDNLYNSVMKTLEQKLHSKRIKKPNWIIYNFLGRLWQFTVARKYKLKTTFIDDPKKEKRFLYSFE